ncbi:threonine/serine ThrE exporter family protein [Lacticaseibacillus mingshuiensis]|uniref:Threonine/serine exporter ThrE family protein n=1 Tax=Lacticaseibacillus mingshuiensis TaxID=2799574 RepID=A0ABW4CL21_9LACO|nr:threonine/serine exporter family protein [Lacticaseibacillus mingshuiensis]
MTAAEKPASTPKISPNHHMAIPWHSFEHDQDTPIRETSLTARAALVGRVGIVMLSCGTGAWRVREAMDTVSRALGLTCAADVGLITLSFSCFEKGHHYSQTLSLPASGVNTAKLAAMEQFVDHFDACLGLTPNEIHSRLDKIQHQPGQFSPLQLGLASALACAAFVFLLGGGPIEMLCCFVGAGVGNYLRSVMGRYHITVMASTALSVAAACLSYTLLFLLLRAGFHIASGHEAGYIGAMLFVIPGFPFITSGLDIFKQDMRSGLERGMFAIMVITVATVTGWLVALLVHLSPANFLPLGLSAGVLLLFRLVASFCGVFGFSIMFNSPVTMSAVAGVIGACANTLRLELVDLTMPPAAAAFLGALLAGLLASLANRKAGYPRISLTVPAIVIMVPGLYMYRGMFNLGGGSFDVGASWVVRAVLIVIALPLGLAVARVLTDPKWRHIS